MGILVTSAYVLLTTFTYPFNCYPIYDFAIVVAENCVNILGIPLEQTVLPTPLSAITR
jgi:hypothetical protein